MNAHHYYRSAINRLIESAAPNPHAVCDEMLDGAQRSAIYFMESSDRFEREVRSLKIVVVVLAVMLIAVAWGGGAEMSLLPCASCPWRVDQRASAIPNYSHKKACGLLNTIGHGDGFRPIMACHGSTEGNNRACNGYLAREGWSNINVRILLAKKKVENPDRVMEACELAGVQLHANYREVLAKLETL